MKTVGQGLPLTWGPVHLFQELLGFEKIKPGEQSRYKDGPTSTKNADQLKKIWAQKV